ncbi:hypothetical protein ACFW9F_27185 [Streptomyces sp. NPDC059506]|uniref:hypothetical protein n=1 Tax=unclassified Streptomyces TaxID=2593676 RepID=UPI0022A9FB26|nr:hypothetical protein [Streptomyces sp. HB2AG]MCZ2523616.1 hypothetical protein [Streptomyces sp. HB2AG]
MKKNTRVRSALAALAAAGLVLTATGCSAVEEAAKEQVNEEVEKITEQEYEVTYEVTGTGIESLDYAPGGGRPAHDLENVEKPTTPWKKTVTLKGIDPPTVTAMLGMEGGEVKCTITHKGKVIEQKSGDGAMGTAACIAISPIAGG